MQNWVVSAPIQNGRGTLKLSVKLRFGTCRRWLPIQNFFHCVVVCWKQYFRMSTYTMDITHSLFRSLRIGSSTSSISSASTTSQLRFKVTDSVFRIQNVEVGDALTVVFSGSKNQVDFIHRWSGREDTKDLKVTNKRLDTWAHAPVFLRYSALEVSTSRTYSFTLPY